MTCHVHRAVVLPAFEVTNHAVINGLHKRDQNKPWHKYGARTGWVCSRTLVT